MPRIIPPPVLTVLLLTTSLILLAAGQEHPPTPPEADPAPPGLPHIRIDRDKKTVDFDARVILREGEWLELLVCSPRTREHEAILVTDAKPSHLHLAMLTIGLKPGRPMWWERTETELHPHPPMGDEVEVAILVEKDGQTLEHPAAHWIIHGETREKMPDSRFLFTGSRFREVQGQRVYLADYEGTVLSLVNFGDDLLVRRTDEQGGQDHGNPDWVPNTELIPPVGTTVVIRLRPATPTRDARHPDNSPSLDDPPPDR